MVDESPYLCVGSAADNTYAQDAALLIDFGGNDTYLNSAGGAPFELADGSTAPVSVNIDLDGDDTYGCDGPSRWGGFPGDLRVCQGGGGKGGVGVLLDASGDDTYVAANPSSNRSTVAAQGGAYMGIGALFDEGGQDRYLARAYEGSDPPAGETTQYMIVQGAASTGGLGLLVDTGLGSDSYTADGGSATRDCAFPCGDTPRLQRYVFAQGAGVDATGAFVDDGGNDLLSATTNVSLREQQAYPWEGILFVPNPIAMLLAQGSSFGPAGTGVALGGTGSTTYSSSLTGSGSVWLTIIGQGGTNWGRSVLDDAGGDDRFLAQASQQQSIRTVIDDSCRDATGARCSRAGLVVEALPWPDTIADSDKFVFLWPLVQVATQGAAVAAPGIGLLEDHTGDDRYSTVTEYGLDVTLEDRLSNPAAPPKVLTDVETWPYYSLVTQGAAEGLPGDVGVLLDHLGRDDYSARLSNRTTAGALSANSPGQPDVRSYAWRGGDRYDEPVGIEAQGAADHATGALLDLGADSSSFDASAEVSATTWPDDAAARQGGHSPLFQGAGVSGVFFSSGLEARIASHPSRQACVDEQHRGFLAWNGCYQIVPPAGAEGRTGWDTNSNAPAVGLAPLTGLGRGASLRLESPNVTDDEVKIEAGLTAGSGAPIEGVPVHFELQSWRGGPLTNLAYGWSESWTIDGLTDTSGVARIKLPLEGVGPDTATPWRILATYDGAPGVWPTHASIPLTHD